ncbi:hypothetical protein O6H91_Y024900 [Diphasiastrum complanatum]|nr:hypothetical protein O6H91_Y024900 [Diphasiastrum complanatum]
MKFGYLKLKGYDQSTIYAQSMKFHVGGRISSDNLCGVGKSVHLIPICSMLFVEDSFDYEELAHFSRSCDPNIFIFSKEIMAKIFFNQIALHILLAAALLKLWHFRYFRPP